LPGDAYSGRTCRFVALEPSCGGAELRTLVVDEEMFAKDVMVGGGTAALAQMKLPQLREELAARDARRTGMKATLQRRGCTRIDCLCRRRLSGAVVRRANADYGGGLSGRKRPAHSIRVMRTERHWDGGCIVLLRHMEECVAHSGVR